MRKMLYIIVVILPILACGTLPTVAAEPQYSIQYPVLSSAPVPRRVSIEMVVMDTDEAHGLNVRDFPNGVVICSACLKNGQVLSVTEILVVGETWWCKHAAGWSACRYLEVMGAR